METTSVLQEKNSEGILLLTLNHEKKTNPFSYLIQQQLIRIFREAELDDAVTAIILFGGKGRSFSAGGDFNDNIGNNDPDDIANKLNLVCDFYIELLKFSKPLICAIDKYAIGMGFQVGILGDYRIGTSDTVFWMPELINGVAVPLGIAMTEFLYGRFTMQRICYECVKMPFQECLELRLLNEITEKDNLVIRAMQVAGQYSKFPQIPFRGSKKSANQRFIDVINEARADTIKVHTATFTSGQHREHMKQILNKNKI